MNNRNLFMIIDNQVKIQENTTMDHREWYISLGLDLNKFENIIRGYIIENKIVFFKGSTFGYDNDVYTAALAYSKSIRHYLNNETLEVWCGISVDGNNKKWEPILRVKEEEIANYIPPVEKKEEPKKEYKETGPLIEFKNNYEDPNFIKIATIVTGIVIILEIILKITLFKEQKVLHFNNPLDVLLSAVQIGLLLYSIYGYVTKKSNTKYISIVASVLIVLTLDVWDIIIGVLYFVFSVDQSYFIKLINLIKGLFKKKEGNKNV